MPENSPFHACILHGPSNIPEGINVILISRTEPPPALIRLRANHQMEVLGWKDLRLTSKESAAIARLRAQQKLSQETVQHIHDLTEGGAAGLVMMLESVNRGTEPHLIGKLRPEEIVDYFGNELFAKTDNEIQDFLLKTAFLPKMTPKLDTPRKAGGLMSGAASKAVDPLT